jgi:hypothetical protein
MIIRLLIVLLCYLFSAFGLLFTIQISIEELRHIKWSNIIVLVWSLCWGLHLFLNVCWIANRKVNVIVVKASLISLVVALLYMPIQGIFLFSGIPLLSIFNVFFILILEVLFALPVIVLAIYLYYLNLIAKTNKIEVHG